MPNDIDLSTEALLKQRAIAEKSAPGPWTMGGETSSWVEDNEGNGICRMLTPESPRNTAAHIAANSPDVVKAHIDEILRLRNDLAATECREGEGDAYVEQLCLERDDLEAQVARLEREAEWLAHNARKGCPPVPPERLPDCDNEEHPHDCASCWREAARKAVEEGVPHA